MPCLIGSYTNMDAVAQCLPLACAVTRAHPCQPHRFALCSAVVVQAPLLGWWFVKCVLAAFDVHHHTPHTDGRLQGELSKHVVLP